jgi:hypothetical protein
MKADAQSPAFAMNERIDLRSLAACGGDCGCQGNCGASIKPRVDVLALEWGSLLAQSKPAATEFWRRAVVEDAYVRATGTNLDPVFSGPLSARLDRLAILLGTSSTATLGALKRSLQDIANIVVLFKDEIDSDPIVQAMIQRFQFNPPRTYQDLVSSVEDILGFNAASAEVTAGCGYSEAQGDRGCDDLGCAGGGDAHCEMVPGKYCICVKDYPFYLRWLFNAFMALLAIAVLIVAASILAPILAGLLAGGGLKVAIAALIAAIAAAESTGSDDGPDA